MPLLHALCEYKKVNALSIRCEVFMPTKAVVGAVPVVMYIHGGALISGNRHGYPTFEREALRKAGYAFVTIDYRLAPETFLSEIVEDVRDALLWVKGEGAKLFNFDPNRVAVMGSSAGGYLSQMTGTFDCCPKAIISFYGYGDILGDWYCKPDPFYCKEPMVSEEDAMKGIGKNPKVWGGRGAYYLRARQMGTWTGLVSGLDVVKDRATIKKYCPLFNITKKYPPIYLLHGDADTDVPYEQSVLMHEALKKNGNVVKLHTEPGGWHGFDGAWSKKPEMFRQVIDFLAEHVK